MQVADFASLWEEALKADLPLLLVSEGSWLSPFVTFNTWLHTCLSSMPFLPFPVSHYYFSDNGETTGSGGSRQLLLQLIKCLSSFIFHSFIHSLYILLVENFHPPLDENLAVPLPPSHNTEEGCCRGGTAP